MKKHLRRDPHQISDDFWWYEENVGISVCLAAYDENGKSYTFVRDIPWRSIRAALKRKDKK